MKSDLSLKELLQDIDSRIAHIEDICADNREIIVKLVTQSNQIVKFLQQLDIQMEDVSHEFEDLSFNTNPTSYETSDKMVKLKELVEQFMDKHQELKEFEEEMKKHKGELTPGQFGES
tara:strand:- start:233 stop:586 length:354 start_codon:yes stop_codon:yes gene_type:complete